MAAKKKARGRPKLPRGQDRPEVMTIRLQKSEKVKLQKAAKKAGESVSAWARRVLLDHAEVG